MSPHKSVCVGGGGGGKDIITTEDNPSMYSHSISDVHLLNLGIRLDDRKKIKIGER